MSRIRSSKKTFLRWLPTIIPILMLMGVGFASFSSNITLESTVTVKANSDESEGANGGFEYSLGYWGSNPRTYSINPAIVRNESDKPYIGWTVSFSVPPGVTSVTCWSATCEVINGLMVLKGLSYNSIIPPNGTASFGVTFNSNDIEFEMTNVMVVGEYEKEPESASEPDGDTGESGGSVDGYVIVPGLAATVTAGSGWGPNDKYTRQFTIILNNESGKSIPEWRIDFNWNTSTHSISSAWGANYEIVDGSRLRFKGTNLTKGGSVYIGGNLTGPSVNWNLSLPLVRGKL